MPTPYTTDFYRRPHLITITYALGVLLFLLPFFNIKCNNISMARLSGVDMATGSQPSMSTELKDMQNGFPGRNNNAISANGGEGKFFITALVALLLGVVGVALSLLNKRPNQRSQMIVGILGAIALIGAWIQVSTYVKNNAGPPGNIDSDSQFSSMVNVTASPTFWFVLCLLCFLAAAFFSYKKREPITGAVTETPPPAAPQIKIENPGDQSEFPSAPEGERDLG
jgi:hypothetical protein